MSAARSAPMAGSGWSPGGGGASHEPPSPSSSSSSYSAAARLSQCSGLEAYHSMRSASSTPWRPSAARAPVTAEVPLRWAPTTRTQGPGGIEGMVASAHPVVDLPEAPPHPGIGVDHPDRLPLEVAHPWRCRGGRRRRVRHAVPPRWPGRRPRPGSRPPGACRCVARPRPARRSARRRRGRRSAAARPEPVVGPRRTAGRTRSGSRPARGCAGHRPSRPAVRPRAAGRTGPTGWRRSSPVPRSPTRCDGPSWSASPR